MTVDLKKQARKGKKQPPRKNREEVAEEREGQEASKAIKATKKAEPIDARKDNHAKHPEVKKKRGTSNGYMPR